MKDIIIILLLTAIVIVGCYWVVTRSESQMSSVSLGGEYHATTTASDGDGNVYSTRTRVVIASTTPAGFTVKGDNNLASPTLGSIIVSSSSAAELIVWNATSTSDDGSNTIAIIADKDTVQNSQGTYVFDVVLNRGLVLDFQSNFNGVYTITWR